LDGSLHVNLGNAERVDPFAGEAGSQVNVGALVENAVDRDVRRDQQERLHDGTEREHSTALKGELAGLSNRQSFKELCVAAKLHASFGKDDTNVVPVPLHVL
jgi:hypothetical protein